jgi:hypothetical protein
MNSGTPGPRSSGYKAVGLTLSPGPGRLAALAIVAIPFLICLIIGVVTAAGSSPPNYGGQSSPLVTATTPSSGTSPSPGSVDDLTSSPSTGYSTDTGAAATVTPTSTPSGSAGPSPSASPDGPAATVQDAYNAIDHRDYRLAFSLGLAEPGQSYASFVAGYKQTASVTVTVNDVSGGVVNVILEATQKDGTEDTYSGTYTVSSNHIVNAQITSGS